jgi:uncharacterized membrane protein YgdD (TMEM256/DUF423 family)
MIHMLKVASLFGLSAVALGAFGAHALKALLEQNQTLEIWKTASFYHLGHSVVLLVLALTLSKARWAFIFFSVGIMIFSGSLYLLALTKLHWLGALTPLGGLALMMGWLFLIAYPTVKSDT